MHRHRFIIPALAVLTLARFALLPTLDLAPIEALTAVAGEHEGWVWAEVGPLMTWLVKVSTFVFGDSEFGVRFWAPLLALITSLLVWRLALEMFDRQTAAWSVVVLNVLPVFNLTSVFFTTGSVSMMGYVLLAFLLRRALSHAEHRQGWWLGVAACMGLLILTDGANGWVILSVGLGIAGARRERSSWLRLGAAWVVLAWLGLMLMWILWNQERGWPFARGEGALPERRVLPNLLRWVVCLSPLLSGMLMSEMWNSARSMRNRAGSEAGMLVGIALPLMVIDFGWGVWRPWPDTGMMVWSVFAVMLLCHRARQSVDVPMRSKVMVRTGIIVLAAFQSLIVLRTDWLRDLGVPWPFAQKTEPNRIYRKFLTADPSGLQHGWKETAKLVSEVVGSSAGSGARWFLVARDWELAAELSFYVKPDLPVVRPTPDHPSVQVFQEGTAVGPYEFWPRYDGMAGESKAFTGAHALYITDDASEKAPPASWLRSFERWRVVSIARVMHGGHPVRTIKIFACHNYSPPDF
jgi:hypothetical protein